jgi:hypothetical protein
MKNKYINLKTKKGVEDSIELVNWRSNFNISIFILTTNQSKEVKEKAYQELMRGADLLDKAHKQQKGGK